MKQFAKLMIACMKECDCLASWRIEEVFFLKYLKQAARISLGSLSPSNEAGDYAWYRVLKGKKVLVISPFAELIEQQYRNKRTRIWNNPNILPEYTSLETIKSVNSVGRHCDFHS